MPVGSRPSDCSIHQAIRGENATSTLDALVLADPRLGRRFCCLRREALRDLEVGLPPLRVANETFDVIRGSLKWRTRAPRRGRVRRRTKRPGGGSARTGRRCARRPSTCRRRLYRNLIRRRPATASRICGKRRRVEVQPRAQPRRRRRDRPSRHRAATASRAPGRPFAPCSTTMREAIHNAAISSGSRSSSGR